MGVKGVGENLCENICGFESAIESASQDHADVSDANF